MTRYVLPKAHPDETLYNLVRRIAWMNGIPSDRQACELLLGDACTPRVSDALVDLVHFCAVTENAYGQPDDVLNNLTIWPFFRQMATHPSVELPRAESPNDRVQPAPLCLGLAGLSNAQPHIWRWCPACVSQDIESYGMAYWHRTHQLPSVLLCPFHGLPLHEVRIPYWARQKCFLDPETLQPDLDSADSWPTDSCADSALEIARFAQMALNAEDGEATPAIVRGAILDGLSTLGLIGRKNDIHPKEFANSFLESHGRLANIDHFSLYLNAKTLARLAKTMNASPVMLPPTLSVMIAHWLFGSWDLFRAHCEWRRAIDTPATLSHAHRLHAESFARAPDQSREEHRQICMKFMTSVSVASRTDFWHAHPKSCRWLAQYDRDWFDSTLPTAKTYAPKQLELF